MDLRRTIVQLASLVPVPALEDFLAPLASCSPREGRLGWNLAQCEL